MHYDSIHYKSMVKRLYDRLQRKEITLKDWAATMRHILGV